MKKESTAATYEWLKLAEKHHISLSDISVAVNSSNWVTLDADPDLTFNQVKVSKMLDFLKSELLPEGELSLSATKLHFLTGQHLLDYIRDTHDTIKEEDVEQ